MVFSYEDSLKYYRDLNTSLDTARDEGVKEGVEKGKLEIAQNALEMGLPISDIYKIDKPEQRANRTVRPMVRIKF